MSFDADAVRARREQMLLRLLFRAQHRMNADMAERVRARGYPGFQPSFTSLLAHVDTDGTTISALARRTGTSRQAVSQLVQTIEDAGLLERRPNPADRRSVVVLHTDAGRRILLDAIAAMTEIEDEYAAALGADDLARLKELLARLAAHADPAGRLGEPDRP